MKIQSGNLKYTYQIPIHAWIGDNYYSRVSIYFDVKRPESIPMPIDPDDKYTVQFAFRNRKTKGNTADGMNIRKIDCNANNALGELKFIRDTLISSRSKIRDTNSCHRISSTASVDKHRDLQYLSTSKGNAEKLKLWCEHAMAYVKDNKSLPTLYLQTNSMGLENRTLSYHTQLKEIRKTPVFFGSDNYLKSLERSDDKVSFMAGVDCYKDHIDPKNVVVTRRTLNKPPWMDNIYNHSIDHLAIKRYLDPLQTGLPHTDDFTMTMGYTMNHLMNTPIAANARILKKKSGLFESGIIRCNVERSTVVSPKTLDVQPVSSGHIKSKVKSFSQTCKKVKG